MYLFTQHGRKRAVSVNTRSGIVTLHFSQSHFTVATETISARTDPKLRLISAALPHLQFTVK